MNTVTLQDAQSWCNHLFGCDPQADYLSRELSCGAGFVIPPDTGKKTALARTLVSRLDANSSGLLLITQHGIWKSNENLDIFYGYRKSLGEHRSLLQAPGHLFGPSDLTTVESLLALSLYFFWDCLLIEDTKEFAIAVSHDEYFDVFTRRRERLTEVVNELLKFGLKRIEN